MKSKCCHMGCSKSAEFEIYDKADRAPDAGTEACSDHVGAMLGRRPHLDLSAPWVFTVVAIAAPTAVTDAMVDRFLSWNLPHDFSPDGMVFFDPLLVGASWPIGTNLLTASQARAMLEHVLSSKEGA